MLVIQRNGIMNLEAGNEEERLRSRGSCEVSDPKKLDFLSVAVFMAATLFLCGQEAEAVLNRTHPS